MKVMQKLRRGATFIEYAMLAGLVAIVVATAVLLFGDKIKDLFSKTSSNTQQVTDGLKEVDLTPKVEKQ